MSSFDFSALIRPLHVAAFVLLTALPGQAQDVSIYDDVLQNGFLNYSYGGQPGDIDFGSTAQAHGGAKSIAFTGNAYNAISFAHTTQAFSTASHPTLRLWVHGGASGGQQLRLFLQLNDAVVAQAELDSYISGGALAAGTWREVTVPLGQAPLSYAGSFDRIDLQSDAGGGQPTLYVDDVSLVAGVAQGVGVLQIERGVTVASMVSDRFTWSDSASKPRVAVLAHNDGQVGPTAGVYENRGGALREFRYQLPDGSTRVAGVTNYDNGGYGGFGYVVSHAANSTCIGDDSPLGYSFPGLFQRVFEGRHHVIFRFTQNYVRNCSTTLPVQQRTIPVTIDWVFATGRDNPLWAITFDLSGTPVNTFFDDSRAPYGELNIDGQGFTNIDGVAWGDRYRFTTTTAPVTLNSQWTWNVPNTVPYVKLWIASTNATMGLVQTQPLSQQDAGGGRNEYYHDLTPYWNKTSAMGNAGGADVMPWQDSWPYQATSFSIGSFASSNNARLTWGTQYGFLGQQTYDTRNGLVATAPGWPKKSYSTYVVMGTHTADPVGAQVAQVETVSSLALSATLGSVVTSGPAGNARADNMTYVPAGYNPVYGALAFLANANRLDANISVGSGTLRKPLLILGGYTGATYPTSVKLGGVSLASDVDYFASIRSGANELWITLNRDLSGAVNHLEVGSASCAGTPPAPTISASGPTTFCSGGNVTLTASIAPGAGVSYLWSPGGQTTQAITATATGSYSVTVTANGCPGTSPATAVTVNSVATPSITAPASATTGQTGLTASTAGVGGDTFAWGIANGTITGGQGTSQITFTAGIAGSLGLTVVRTSGGCASPQGTASVTVTAVAGGCTPNATTLCLNNSRFRLSVAWKNPYDGGTTGVGTAVPLTSDSGYFWFFASSNIELVIKVLDGRAVNGKFWVLYGALSDVEYTITITDTQNGNVKTYFNPGRNLASVADVSAFPGARPDSGASPTSRGSDASYGALATYQLAAAAGAGRRPLGPATVDKWSLWSSGVKLRGANVFQRRRYGFDGTEFLGSGVVGPPFTQQDFDRLAALGANVVQLSHPGLYSENPPYVLDSAVQSNLDSFVSMASQAGLYVVIGFRTGPGRSEATFGYFPAGYDNDAVWTNQAAHDAWAEMWRAVAQRYSGNPAVVGYDLMVEPNSNARLLNQYDPAAFYTQYGGTLYDWNTLYPSITTAIRQVDAATPILIGGMSFSSIYWLNSLQPTSDTKTVYAVHNYEPFVYTHQSPPNLTLAYPGSFDADGDGTIDNVNLAWLRQSLAPIDTFKAAHPGKPVAVNEFGVKRWQPGADQYVRDLTTVLEEKGANHALWTWASSWAPGASDDDFNFRHGADPNSHTDVVSSPLLSAVTADLARNAAAGCTGGATLCLASDRFRLSVAWRNYNDGSTGVGTAVKLTDDSGTFWFFNAANVELMLKVLDGRATNGKFWVFYGALSDVEYTITVTDTQTSAVKTYVNPAHTLGSRADINAF